MFCSCKYQIRYDIDYPHVYHVISQSKEFEEPSHHDISVRWRNTFYQISYLSADNEEFDKDGLSVQIKWFNHLPIYNEKYIPDESKMENYPC